MVATRSGRSKTSADAAESTLALCTTELRLRRCRPPLAKRTLARLLRDCLDTDGRASREQDQE